MAARSLLVLGTGLALLLACSQEADVASAPPPAGPSSVAGTYRVEGTTTVIGTDESREITGTVIMVQEGDNYSATFNLETVYPGPDGALPAEVIGTAEGKVEGASLQGTARTQIVASRVPGLDSRFTLVPPAFGVRVVSDTNGEMNPDGSIELAIVTRGEEGQQYIPTRTQIKGNRVPPGSGS